MKKKFQFFYPKCDIIRTNARFLTSAKISFQVQSKYIPSLLDFRSKHRRNFPPFLGIIWGAAYLTPPPRRLTYVDTSRRQPSKQPGPGTSCRHLWGEVLELQTSK